MKKAIIVSCFDWYFGRIKYIEKYLKDNGFIVDIWCSDYDHINKCSIVKVPECNYIHVHPYKKNISIARVYSHFDFARKIRSVLEKQKPNLVYALIPPNSVAWACAKYKKKNPENKIVFDIIDMWPESYPKPRVFQLPFYFWRKIRDNNLNIADHIFTECQLYQSYLTAIPKNKISTLWLCREESKFSGFPKWDGVSVNIGYLGSINNIIDIPLIETLIHELSKFFKVNVHIVGGGQNKDIFIEALKKDSVNIYYHGVIFDKEKIRNIIGACHFAINIMKPTVCVGLTIKSLDYFQLGVPILNTIAGDTSTLIEQYNCGYNIKNYKYFAESLKLLKSQDYEKIRINTQNVFNKFFTIKAFFLCLSKNMKLFNNTRNIK